MVGLIYGIILSLINALSMFLIFIPKIKKRRDFELKNLNEVYSNASFDCAYEVSSEGEFEQAKYFIEQDLKLLKNVEIIYFSPSVEKNIKSFESLWPNRVKSIRYPLISFSFFNPKRNLFKFVTAHELTLCRYDFFPELFIIGRKLNSFNLIWASLKNKNLTNPISRIFLKCIYSSFTKIITPLSSQKILIEKLGVPADKISVFEARIPQIKSRLANANTKFSKHAWMSFFVESLKSIKKTKIIFGSFYNSEMFLINSELIKKIEGSEVSLMILPHQVNGVDFGQFKRELSQLSKFIHAIELSNTDSLESVHEKLSFSQTNPTIIYLNVKGFLCELYPYFDIAYVGGGFNYSVHSLLEPYLSNAFVLCGPKTERSTEINYIQENHAQNLLKIDSSDVNWSTILSLKNQKSLLL
jgi:3-deoxy-D-manno-octulosonic-acid transferase